MTTERADFPGVGKLILNLTNDGEHGYIPGSVYIPEEKKDEVARRVSKELKRRIRAGLLTLILIFTAAQCKAETITDSRMETAVIRTIVGEASNQGQEGMLALAAAIRNRGHLRGAYGLNASHSDREPAWVWDQARTAWKKSQSQDPTEGANHWFSREDIQKLKQTTPKWFKRLQFTKRIGDHFFYKETTHDKHRQKMPVLP